MAGRHQALEEAVETLKEEAGPQTFFTFLQLVKRAVEVILNAQGSQGRVVRKDHHIFGPIIRDNAQARLVMYMLGFEDVDKDEKVMVMFDFDGHAAGLRSFKDIAEKQLATTSSNASSSSILSLSQDAAQESVTSADVAFDETEGFPVTCARLGFFYFSQFMPRVLFESNSPPLERKNQVSICIQVIEKCLLVLGVGQPGGMSHQSWASCRDRALQLCEVSFPIMNRLGETMSLSEKMTTAANLISNEVRIQLSEQVLDVFVSMHLFSHLYNQTSMGQILTASHMYDLVRMSCSLPSGVFSQQCMDSVEKVRSVLLEAASRPLSPAEIGDLHQAVKQQMRMFFQELCPSQRRQQLGHGRRLGTAAELAMTDMVVKGEEVPDAVAVHYSDGLEVSGEDEDEKKDAPEKLHKEDDDACSSPSSLNGQRKAVAIVRPYADEDKPDPLCKEECGFKDIFSRLSQVSSESECRSINSEIGDLIKEKKALVSKCEEDCAALQAAVESCGGIRVVVDTLTESLHENLKINKKFEDEIEELDHLLVLLKEKAECLAAEASARSTVNDFDVDLLRILLKRIADGALDSQVVFLAAEIEVFMLEFLSLIKKK
eukprot:m.59658 g.59658  ORF g.59658 m.59658 type:complete len:602 (+) comp34892_c0_seq7:31-1836(+)